MQSNPESPATSVPNEPGMTGRRSLEDRLQAGCFNFDFFQALRLLDIQYGQKRFPRLGHSSSRSGDPIHLGQRPFLNFAPRTLDLWSPGPVDGCRFERPVLLVYFLGLFGPNGPLPLHITEHALERERARDFTLTNFTNILQHRFLCFYYRAWSSSRMAVDMDRPGHTRSARFVGSLAGVRSHDAIRSTPPRPDGKRETPKVSIPNSQSSAAGDDTSSTGDNSESWSRLFFSGHLSSRNRHAEGLASILSSYFAVPVRIEMMRGRWLELPKGAETRLASKGEAALLGQTTLLGSCVWETQGSFRVRIGPIPLKKMKRLLPGCEGACRLKRWVLDYVGPTFDWDIQLILAKEEVPDAHLNGTSLLGLTTFLKQQAAISDVETVIFNLLDEPQTSGGAPIENIA